MYGSVGVPRQHRNRTVQNPLRFAALERSGAAFPSGKLSTVPAALAVGAECGCAGRNFRTQDSSVLLEDVAEHELPRLPEERQRDRRELAVLALCSESVNLQNYRQTTERTQPADDAPERTDLRSAGDRADAPGERHHRVSEDEGQIPFAKDREGFRHVVELAACHPPSTNYTHHSSATTRSPTAAVLLSLVQLIANRNQILIGKFFSFSSFASPVLFSFV